MRAGIRQKEPARQLAHRTIDRFRLATRTLVTQICRQTTCFQKSPGRGIKRYITCLVLMAKAKRHEANQHGKRGQDLDQKSTDREAHVIK